MVADRCITFTVVDLSSAIKENCPTNEWLRKSIPGAELHNINDDVVPAVWSRVIRRYFLDSVDSVRTGFIMSGKPTAPAQAALAFQRRCLGAFVQTGDEQNQTLSALGQAEQVINIQNTKLKALADKRGHLASARSSFARYGEMFPFINRQLVECINAVDEEIAAVDAAPYLEGAEVDRLAGALVKVQGLLTKAWKVPSHSSVAGASDFTAHFIERNVHMSLRNAVHSRLTGLQVR